MVLTTSEPVLARVIEYWRSIDQAVGNRVATGRGLKAEVAGRRDQGREEINTSDLLPLNRQLRESLTKNRPNFRAVPSFSGSIATLSAATTT